MHQALIDELCHPLRDGLRGYWGIFDGETVGRFVQYLYQADCSFPMPPPVGNMTPRDTTSGGDSSPGSPSASNATDGISELSMKTPTPSRPLTPLGSFKIPEHPPPKCPSPAQSGTPAGYSNEAVLLAQAKLYVLSYSQGIYALSDMCFGALLNRLIEISSPQNDARTLESVIGLLRYVYYPPFSDATPQPLQPAWAELQSLASQFCAPNIGFIAEDREFQVLLQKGGALATDMMAKIVRHLRSVEVALAEANEATAAAKSDLAEANMAATTAEAALADATRTTTTGTRTRTFFGDLSDEESTISN